MKITRREFLKQGGALAGSILLGELAPLFAEEKPLVVVVRAQNLLDDTGAVRGELITRMLTRGICELTGISESSKAWGRFVSEKDSVVINEAGTWLPNTPEVLLETVSSCWSLKPRQLKLAYYPHQTKLWKKSIREGLKARGVPQSVMDSRLIKRIPVKPFTTLIMLPTLKSHDVAGVSGVVKHFATISLEGPAVHHPNGMKTAGSVIRKQFGHLKKLIIVDAVRFYQTTEGGFYYEKALLFGTDPVAVDTIALELFLKHCVPKGRILPRLHIESADRDYGAGESDKSKIEIRQINL